MKTSSDEMKVVEAYEKPSMQVYEMEPETALMAHSSNKGNGNGNNGSKGDGNINSEANGNGIENDKGYNNGNNVKSSMPAHNTRPYMGDYK